MNVQFHHKRSHSITYFELGDIRGHKVTFEAKGGTTIALQVPTLEQFDAFKIYPLDHWGTYPSIELKFGIAKCSNLDNYNKKLGRKISLGRMDNVCFWVRKNSEDELVLADFNFKFPELILRKSPQGGRVYLVGVK